MNPLRALESQRRSAEAAQNWPEATRLTNLMAEAGAFGEKPGQRTCSRASCGDKVRAWGLCETHFQREYQRRQRARAKVGSGKGAAAKA